MDMEEENFVFNKPAADNTVQQILDNYMLWLSEYTVFMFFGPQNTKIIIKFIG